MPNANDSESLVNARRTANLLVQDLRDQMKPANLMLAEIAIEILELVVLFEQKLSRLEFNAK